MSGSGAGRFPTPTTITATAMSIPLTPDEMAVLVQCEDVIDDVIAVSRTLFRQAGECLDRIREGRLYRQTHSTFAAYIKDRFDIGPAYAYKIIAAAKVVAELPSSIGDMIVVESQARELTGLTPEEAVVVVGAVAKTGEVTATRLRDAREDLVTLSPAAGAESEAARSNLAPRSPKPDRRRSLPDTYTSAIWELDKAVQRLVRLHADDRWPQHRQIVGGRHLGQLTSLLDALMVVANEIQNGPWVG